MITANLQIIVIAAVIVFLSGTPTRADIITFAGTIGGTFNGQAISATTTGNFDTTGVGGNSGSISFTQLPLGIDASTGIKLPAASLFSIVCSASAIAGPGASNLFTLTGGNYSYNRVISYVDFPGSSWQSSGNVATSGSVTTYNLNVLANYAGPTDLIDITSYQALWESTGQGILETGSAEITRSGGEPLRLMWTTTYSTGGALSIPQRVSINFAIQGSTPTMANISWQGRVEAIPEPTTMLLLGTGLVGVAVKVRKHRKVRESKNV